MNKFVFSLIFAASLSGFAQTKVAMNFPSEELMKVIETYAKASGQKFIIDPSVRGRVSMLNQDTLTLEEAFNQLSQALAINGFAISKQGDIMIIKSARNIQRDLIEVSEQVPALNPQRMYSWVYRVQNMPADMVNRDLRILTSKDGELAVNSSTNQIVVTDWTSNVLRIHEMMKQLDKPVDAKIAKIVEANKAERKARQKEKDKEKEKEQVKKD